jgi:hypothetical protein
LQFQGGSLFFQIKTQPLGVVVQESLKQDPVIPHLLRPQGRGKRRGREKNKQGENNRKTPVKEERSTFFKP